MSEEFSGMTYADIMDDIFARSKSFSVKEYYDEMVRICPELKKKWWERIPSEEQVKKMVADWYSLAAIDGKESIPEAEKKPALGAASRYRTDTPAGASGRTRKPIPTWQKETTTVHCPSL